MAIDGPSLSNASASVLDTQEVLPSAEGLSSTTGARLSSTTGLALSSGPEPLRANTTINIDYCRGKVSRYKSTECEVGRE